MSETPTAQTPQLLTHQTFPRRFDLTDPAVQTRFSSLGVKISQDALSVCINAKEVPDWSSKEQPKAKEVGTPSGQGGQEGGTSASGDQKDGSDG